MSAANTSNLESEEHAGYGFDESSSHTKSDQVLHFIHDMVAQWLNLWATEGKVPRSALPSYHDWVFEQDP